MVEETDDEGFKEILEENPKVVLDLWASWCMPCVKLAPVLEKISTEYGDVAFCKINIQDHMETAQENNVSSIPTLLFYKDGQVVERVTGLVSEEKIRETLKNVF